MLKIGDFAKLSRVSIKTLRYYDEVGLLKPSAVDPFTGYRAYSLDLLPRLNRILALKDLGMSLEQIGYLLDEDVPAEQIRGMLRLKQGELRQRVADEQARLERVEARLRWIEQEGKMPEYDVVLKSVEAMRVAGTYGEGSPETIGQTFGALLGEVGAFVAGSGAGFAGPPLTLYFEMEGQNDWHFEVAVPISRNLPGTERVKVHELPAASTVASVVHQGAYGSIGEAYAAVMSWIEGNGYRICGPSREVYLQFDQEHPERNLTEIQFLVEK